LVHCESYLTPLTMQIENFLPFGLPNQYQR